MMVPALVVGTLTACTPGSQPVAALAMRDGRPLAILVTCGGDFAQISVYQNDESARPTPTGGVDTLIEWRVSGEPAGEVVEAPLFGTPPDGWQTSDPTSEPPEGPVGPDRVTDRADTRSPVQPERAQWPGLGAGALHHR